LCYNSGAGPCDLSPGGYSLWSRAAIPSQTMVGRLFRMPQIAGDIVYIPREGVPNDEVERHNLPYCTADTGNLREALAEVVWSTEKATHPHSQRSWLIFTQMVLVGVAFRERK
jgi:hypothetical protein